VRQRCSPIPLHRQSSVRKRFAPRHPTSTHPAGRSPLRNANFARDKTYSSTQVRKRSAPHFDCRFEGSRFVKVIAGCYLPTVTSRCPYPTEIQLCWKVGNVAVDAVRFTRNIQRPLKPSPSTPAARRHLASLIVITKERMALSLLELSGFPLTSKNAQGCSHLALRRLTYVWQGHASHATVPAIPSDSPGPLPLRQNRDMARPRPQHRCVKVVASCQRSARRHSLGFQRCFTAGIDEIMMMHCLHRLRRNSVAGHV